MSLSVIPLEIFADPHNKSGNPSNVNHIEKESHWPTRSFRLHEYVVII
jgi:hypothetical protein